MNANDAGVAAHPTDCFRLLQPLADGCSHLAHGPPTTCEPFCLDDETDAELGIEEPEVVEAVAALVQEFGQLFLDQPVSGQPESVAAPVFVQSVAEASVVASVGVVDAVAADVPWQWWEQTDGTCIWVGSLGSQRRHVGFSIASASAAFSADGEWQQFQSPKPDRYCWWWHAPSGYWFYSENGTCTKPSLWV